MIWALIPNWLKIVAGGLLCVGVVASGSYWLGKREGRSQAATEALAKTVEVLQSRNDTNVEINSSAAAELCAHYGLPDEEHLECVRRVEQASANARNSSEDHNGRSAVR